MVIRVWNTYGMTAVWIALGGLLALLVIGKISYWYNGYHGLNQWPNPHGRYYNRWLSLKNCDLDYYPWLEIEKKREAEERRTIHA